MVQKNGKAKSQSETIIQKLKPGDILVYTAREKGIPYHVEYYVGKENDRASFVGINQGDKMKKTEKYEVYSNGLDKWYVKNEVNMSGGNWLIGVIRPIPPNKWNNT